ncbi:MAG: hypothetical protein U1F18_06185 [Steroidobacteraceae bacterium]
MQTIDVAGPWFEDFERGLEFEAPAVTLTEGLAAQYQALFGDRLRDCRSTTTPAARSPGRRSCIHCS